MSYKCANLIRTGQVLVYPLVEAGLIGEPWAMDPESPCGNAVNGSLASCYDDVRREWRN